MKKYRLIVFDHDGTLVDTLADIAAAANWALAQRGICGPAVDVYRQWVGWGMRPTLDRALAFASGRADAMADDALFELMRTYYANHPVVHSRLYPGAVDLVASIRSAGIKMAIFSNKEQVVLDQIVQTLFPSHAFHAVIGNGPGIKMKPAADEILRLQGLWGLSLDEIVMVGDSEVDGQLAQAAGIDFYFVEWGYRSRHELKIPVTKSFLNMASLLQVLCDLR